MAGYIQDDITPEELEREKTLYGPFTEAVRDLVDATIRTLVDDDEIRRAQAEIEEITARSSWTARTASASAGPAAAGPGATPWSGCATPWPRRW
jgi:hypothetical protein